jgi:hypothetical protein
MILSEKVLMVEPRNFSFNEETSVDNFFQSPGTIKIPAEASMKEFNDLKYKLMKAGIIVQVVSPVDEFYTPDGVFPNNWLSTTPEGKLILYPMMALNRRKERRKEIIGKLKTQYKECIDLSALEEKGFFLEGTGSLVIDHENKTAYASLSKRTSKEALNEWCKQTGYEAVVFSSTNDNNEIIYHTNVVMSLCDKFSIVCLDAIKDKNEKEILLERLLKRNEVITISMEQMRSFCGNCLELKNGNGDNFLVMSTQAYQAFTEDQKSSMIRHTTLIHSNLDTIETIGGGSARCMMAELF